MKFRRDDGVVMEARNDLQASAFITSGWKRISDVAEPAAQEPETEPAAQDSKQPARRGRKPAGQK